MLLRFSVSNFLSLRNSVELNFVAHPLKERAENTVPSRFAKHGVLPIVVLYGANASGKSNVLAALRLLRSLILGSFVREEESLVHKPFLLDEESRHLPTELCLDFLFEGVRYQFGVKYDSDRVIEEWLFAFPNIVQQTLYTRSLSEEGEKFVFGRALHGSNKQIQSITRPSSLFISAAAKSNHPLLTRIAQYFRHHIANVNTASTKSPMDIAQALEGDEKLIERIVKHLATADTGIVEFRIEDASVPEEFKSQLNEFITVMTKIAGPNGNFKIPDKTVRLGHRSEAGEVKFLDYSDESLGTRHLLSLLPDLLKAIDRGGVLILDEITTGLHTLLAKHLVQIFMSRELNPNGAQLIFSTHDTNLLSPGILRRDSIWFAEKSSSGVTSIFPLTDVRTKNSDNIERGYIQGRFGAIPFLEAVGEGEAL